MTFWQALQGGYVPALQCEAYLSYLRTLPCVITGAPAEPHHIVGHWMRGSGKRTSDFLAFPLAPELHRADYATGLHHMGHKAWEAQNGSQLEWAARTLLQAVYDGVLRY